MKGSVGSIRDLEGFPYGFYKGARRVVLELRIPFRAFHRPC